MIEHVHQAAAVLEDDSAFEPGALEHLSVGARGRMLDPRRTPIEITDVRPTIGVFELEIRDFEDRGARWTLPLEDVRRFQFRLGESRATREEVEVFESAIERLDQQLVVDAPEHRSATARLLLQERESASGWLHEAVPDASERVAAAIAGVEGDPEIQSAFQAWMGERNLADIESRFAADFVSNPYAGEFVKAHRVAIAELGLCAFHGTMIRDPQVQKHPWTTERRKAHIVSRYAFVQALFDEANLPEVVLYRGITSAGTLRKPTPASFVSATFLRSIAESCVQVIPTVDFGQLTWQRVPATRIFMTHIETSALDDKYREAEAVLLGEHANPLF